VSNELERMWKEAVMASFKVLSRHFPGGTAETTKNLSQDSWSLGRDLNLGPTEHEAEELTTKLRCSVLYVLNIPQAMNNVQHNPLKMH
jgi:hypothetical protein